MAINCKELQTKSELDVNEKALEETLGNAALAWVDRQNLITKRQFEKSEGFSEAEKLALELLENKQKIPFVKEHNGFLYNFWRDSQYPNGVWRRTTLTEYRKPEPKWEVILNLAFSAAEEAELDALIDVTRKNPNHKESWVLRRTIFCYPDCQRVMLELSLGGKDIAVYREFDLVKKTFVKDGFQIKEAFTGVGWCDANSLWVKTKFSPSSLTKTDECREIRLWRRGQKIEESTLVFMGDQTDSFLLVENFFRSEGQYRCVTRSIELYKREYYLLNPKASDQEKETKSNKMPVPDFAILQGFFHDQAIFYLREDWQVQNGPRYKMGSVVSLSLASIRSPNGLKTHLLFEPTATCVVDSYSKPYLSNAVFSCKNFVLVKILNNICSELRRYQFKNNRWESVVFPLPALGSIENIETNDMSDCCFVTYENYLQPATLYHVDNQNMAVEALKAELETFNATNMEVKQYSIKSKSDGVEIPYFLISPKSMNTQKGGTPTILFGYGAFQIGLLPNYWKEMGALWLKQGGAYVIANLRGGGEFGTEWHKAGIKENRSKSIEDFISIAEDLISKKITTAEQLGIYGGSAGGIIICSAFLRRPELFSVVLCVNPVLDLFDSHNDTFKGEYGDANDSSMKKLLSDISPWELVQRADPNKLKAKSPSLLFMTNTSDTRVKPGQSRRMVSKLQSFGVEVGFWENTDGGHIQQMLGQGAKGVAFETTLKFQIFISRLMKNKTQNRMDETNGKSPESSKAGSTGNAVAAGSYLPSFNKRTNETEESMEMNRIHPTLSSGKKKLYTHV